MNKTSNLNVRIDENVKKASEKIFEELGLNMSTAINIFLRQVIRVKGIPFEIKSTTVNSETLEAINESIKLANDYTKGYPSIEELKKALEV